MSKQNLLRQLDELVAFTKTPACSSILATRRIDIDNVKGQILSRKPVTPEDIAILNQLHGQWESLEEELQIFETAMTSLKERIAKYDVADTESHQDTTDTL